MSLTNDPQAGYVAEQRELLSDHYIEKQLKYIEALVIACKVVGHDIGEDISLANEAVKTLQAMLTSGELMVVRMVKESNIVRLNSSDYRMPCCGKTFDSYSDAIPSVGEFCRCGARIIE